MVKQTVQIISGPELHDLTKAYLYMHDGHRVEFKLRDDEGNAFAVHIKITGLKYLSGRYERRNEQSFCGLLVNPVKTPVKELSGRPAIVGFYDAEMKCGWISRNDS